MRIIRYRNVPVVELDTIKASDAFGPGSSPGGHTICESTIEIRTL